MSRHNDRASREAEQPKAPLNRCQRRAAAKAPDTPPPLPDLSREPYERIMRNDELDLVTGISRSTRWRLERDGLFPPGRRIAPGATGWLFSEILLWLRGRWPPPRPCRGGRLIKASTAGGPAPL
jgi:prophage regulatory protein